MFLTTVSFDAGWFLTSNSYSFGGYIQIDLLVKRINYIWLNFEIEKVQKCFLKLVVMLLLLLVDVLKCMAASWVAGFFLLMAYLFLGSLPCLLCLRCVRDTFIPEETMLRDPRRLYAPGRCYHIVERMPFRWEFLVQLILVQLVCMSVENTILIRKHWLLNLKSGFQNQIMPWIQTEIFVFIISNISFIIISIMLSISFMIC